MKLEYAPLAGSPMISEPWFYFALGLAGGRIVTLHMKPKHADYAVAIARKASETLPVYINVALDDSLALDEWIVVGNRAVGSDPP